jgi:hypothetical protein
VENLNFLLILLTLFGDDIVLSFHNGSYSLEVSIFKANLKFIFRTSFLCSLSEWW